MNVYEIGSLSEKLASNTYPTPTPAGASCWA